MHWGIECRSLEHRGLSDLNTQLSARAKRGLFVLCFPASLLAAGAVGLAYRVDMSSDIRQQNGAFTDSLLAATH